MRLRTLAATVLATTLLAGTATALEEATWTYTVPEAIAPGEELTLGVDLSVPDATFDADRPVGYRHFLLDADGTPQTDVEVRWSRDDASGVATVDGDGAIVVPDEPFARGTTPSLGTTDGDHHELELSLPAGQYFLFSDLVDLSPPTLRLAGDDRYATAAAATRRAFDPGVATVFVASGTSFADALAAGPLAAHRDAPLLLTGPTTLPRATRDELRRLDPDRIVVVGGANAVSDDVERELAPYAGTVRRVAGVDRYDTAARVARDGWGADGAARAYVANGRSAPDALGAAARAALDDVPVLLVDADRVPGPTAAAVDALGVEQVVVAGGQVVVDAATYNALRSRAGAAVRRSGPDRYATSAALADRPGGQRTLLVTTGEDFPDALAAGALARRLDADLLLTRTTTLPEVVRDRAATLAPRRVRAFGGTAAVAAGVLGRLDALRSPLTPLYRTPLVADGATSFRVGAEPDPEPTGTEAP